MITMRSIFNYAVLTTSLILSVPGNTLPAKTNNNRPTEDKVSILDLSKPAFFTPQNTKWGKAPAFLPEGASLTILEGDPNQAGPFTIRLKLPAYYEFPAHWCSMDEHISVISGHLLIGMGDKMDKNKTTSFPAGSFARIPLKMHHYVFATEETIVQLHGTGPWIIGYANPAEDPNPTVHQNSEDNKIQENSQRSMDNLDMRDELDLDRLH